VSGAARELLHWWLFMLLFLLVIVLDDVFIRFLGGTA
jgi:hypothetical protein